MKVGQIVKFKNIDGTINGGTITSFQKNSNGENIVLLNTLDGKKLSVLQSDCIKIGHQITGKQSKKFIDSIKKEIEVYNKGLNQHPDVFKHKEETQLWINKYNEQSNIIDEKQKQIDFLINENNDLIEKLKTLENEHQHLQSKYNEYTDKNKISIEVIEKLQYVIIGLKKVIIAGAENNNKEQLEALLDIIIDFNC